MKNFCLIFLTVFFFSCKQQSSEIPDHFRHVDQVIWVVENMNNTVAHWKDLGFNQVLDLDTVDATLITSRKEVKLKMARANLGGSNITWIEPLEGESVFSEFRTSYGDGAMSLVHRMDSKKALQQEWKRLSKIGLDIREEIEILTGKGELYYILMDSRDEGKYYLGYTYGDKGLEMIQELSSANLHNMKINQYAFAIHDAEPVSEYWHKIGQPEFQISYPELGNTHYYGEIVDHELIQGWQRQFDISYEWCIPVRTPIVYEDHIRKHGEGIHHLAFTVEDMDKVLEDYKSKGYTVSMGGTWGEEGKPGSGRYEYIDLENTGGLTMELLWNYKE